MHYLVKQLFPPILNTLRWYSLKYGWKGNYSSFEAANSHSKGYNATHILDRIVTTTKKVRDQEIPFERDGIEYAELKMNYPLLSTLLWAASQNNQALTVLDFGGSLGTCYFQNKAFLSGLKNLQWCIIEQSNYVEIGKKEFESDQLHFYYTIDECLQQHSPQIILLNSVLQYIEQPYSLLTSFKETKIPFLYFDFTAYISGQEDRYTIQHVPPAFYGIDASYACCFFSKAKMFKFLDQYYTMVYEFISEPDKYFLELMPFQYEGQLWKLN